MDLKLNLRQLTKKELKQVSGGTRAQQVKICRCKGNDVGRDFVASDDRFNIIL